MTADLHYHLNRPYTIHVVPDCGSFGEQLYLASVAELPGCESHAATPEAALCNIRDAMGVYIASMLDDGIEPPPPEEFGVSAVWSIRAHNYRPAVATTELIGRRRTAALA